MKDELKPLEKYLSEFSYNSRKPFYNDDSDYTTNSPSYYDDLARKNKLIKHLALRIWDYDEELSKRFAEWDKNLEEFDDEVLILLQEWMDDGTFDEIINEHIFNDLREEIIKIKNNISYYPISITEFGAEGNGADDTIPIQQALDSKRLIYIPSKGGPYRYSELTIPPDSIGIVGDGLTTTGSVLEHIPGPGTISWNGKDRVLNFRMENLYIKGSSHENEGFGVDGSGISYSRFNNVHIRNFTSDAFYVDGVIRPVVQQFSNNTFTHCRFNNNLGNGIKMISSDRHNNENTANSFIGCEFAGNSKDGIHEEVGESNHYIGCTAQGNGNYDIYMNGNTARFNGYVENAVSKTVFLGEKSQRNEISARSSFPIWNTFIDEGNLNKKSVMGESSIQKHLFHDPYFFKIKSDLLPNNIFANGDIKTEYIKNSSSPSGEVMRVTFNENFQGLRIGLGNENRHLKGEWITVFIDIDDSGIIDPVHTRLYTRIGEQRNAGIGQFVAYDINKKTAPGVFKTLIYDVKLSNEDIGNPGLTWYLGYSGVTNDNYVDIKSIHVVEGKTSEMSYYIGNIDESPEIVRNSDLENSDSPINIKGKKRGKIVYNTERGKLFFSTGDEIESNWMQSDDSSVVISPIL